MFRPPSIARLRLLKAASPLLAAWLLVLLTACGEATGTPSSTPTTAPSPTATSTPASSTVKVYFARHPDTDNDPSVVFPVEREGSGPATPTFALEQLFKGPSADEKAQGYYSPFESAFGLISYCKGDFRDFDLTLNQRGAAPEQGTATLTFCRVVSIAGDLDGPRMKAMVAMTLLQFPMIKKVILLNHDGNCFDDLQGSNQCLNG